MVAAASTDAGATWSAPVRLSDDDVTATHQRVIWTTSGARIFWTQKRAGEPQEWTMRSLAPAAIVRHAPIR